jgi:hypothetical protein
MEQGLVQAINQYGFPIIAAMGVGYMIYYVWTWATTEVKPVLSEANTVLIGLIDRIRMLDNDLIRLNQKLNIVLMLRGKEIESQRHLDDAVADVAAKEKEQEVQRTLKRKTNKTMPDSS